jgi:hypothetical protein
MDEIIQLKITLQWTKPPIWRRFLVEKSITFHNLHHIIQDVMGWCNYHLYDFTVNGDRIMKPFEDNEDDEAIDSSKITIDSYLKVPTQKFHYLYDFGDSWEHLLTVEKILPREANVQYPVCIKGRLSCPPEDCGSIPGYYNMLEIIKNKKHPEHKEMLEWLGEDYDPEYFNLEEINEALKTNALQGYEDW